MNLARESFNTLIYQISGFLCAAVTGMIIARVLGPENRGILAVALLSPFFFLSLFNPSINLAIVHHMGQKKYDRSLFMGSALIFFGFLSFVGIAVFLITVLSYRDFFYRGVKLEYLLASMLSLPFYYLLYYFASILQGGMYIKQYNVANQLPSYSNLFFVVIFIICLRLDVMTAIIAAIGSVILGGLYATYMAARACGRPSFDNRLTTDLLKDGGKLYLGALATFVANQGNVFILNYYAQPSEVGYYTVSYTIAGVLLFFLTSLGVALYPKISHSSMEETFELIEVASRQIFLITAVATFIVAIFSKQLVRLYGGEAFLPSVSPLLLLLPGTLISVIPAILANLWLRKGWFVMCTVLAMFYATSSLLLNFALVPKFGSRGAALAITLSNCSLLILEIAIYMKYVKRNVSALIIPRREDIAIYKNLIEGFKSSGWRPRLF